VDVKYSIRQWLTIKEEFKEEDRVYQIDTAENQAMVLEQVVSKEKTVVINMAEQY
jgi:hypothetical protein